MLSVPGTCESPTAEHSPANITTTDIPVAITSNNDEIHLLVCGSSKVGKSSLINALAGCVVAKTGSGIGLDQCTRAVNCYQLNRIRFWDTPGIQEWSHLDIGSYIRASSLHQPPLCMFYCASPGSFAKLQQVELFLDECGRRHIFCALVVTNMFSNTNRDAALHDFKGLLAKYVEKSEVREERGVWYYGKVGLCTMVNSHEYEGPGDRKPQQGVHELILAVIKSLNEPQLLRNWFQTIEDNRKFWMEKQEELYELAQQAELNM